jgi:SpoVK/Ycf46/Vps4 family AAA+-type ATPase
MSSRPEQRPRPEPIPERKFRVEIADLPEKYVQAIKAGKMVSLATQYYPDKHPLRSIQVDLVPDAGEFIVRARINNIFSREVAINFQKLMVGLQQLYPMAMMGGFPVFESPKGIQFTVENTRNSGFRIIAVGFSDVRGVSHVMPEFAEFLETVVESAFYTCGIFAPKMELKLALPETQAKDEAAAKEQEAEAKKAEDKAVFNETVTFKDIGGNEDLKSVLRTLAAGIRNPELYKRWGSKPPRAILLHGPSGTGKTLAANALANEAGVRFVALSSEKIFNMYVGNSEKNIAGVFDEADQYPGQTILFIDEIESIFSNRALHADSSARSSVHGILLQRIDGLKTSGKVTLVGATNLIDVLDPALISRFSRQIEVPLPDAQARMEIFNIHAKRYEREAGRKIFRGIDWAELVDATEGKSGRDIEGIVWLAIDAKINAEVERSLSRRRGRVSNTINHEELMTALLNHRPEKKQRPPLSFPGLLEETVSRPRNR